MRYHHLNIINNTKMVVAHKIIGFPRLNDFCLNVTIPCQIVAINPAIHIFVARVLLI
jgi:hypothetical protein